MGRDLVSSAIPAAGYLTESNPGKDIVREIDMSYRDRTYIIFDGDNDI